MPTAPLHALPAAKRRRLIVIGLPRASAATAALVAAYSPVAARPPGRCSAGGVARGWAARVDRHDGLSGTSDHQGSVSGIRAIEALAATYVLMAWAEPSNFNVPALTRPDLLYFMVTVFATVGFGDITATSQPARLIVTAQMILDLILGLGIRVFLGAVQRGRQQDTA